MRANCGATPAGERGVRECFLDSSLGIDLFHGVSAARAFMDSHAGRTSLLFHAAVVAELSEGMANAKEYRAIDALLVHGTVVIPSDHDITTSLKLLRRHRPAHGVDWHDCLIAASALRLGVPVATLNDKHFRAFKGLNVVRPY